MRTKTNKTCIVIALMTMLTIGVQPASSQGFLNSIKKAIKKVENTVNNVNETVNNVGEAVNSVGETVNSVGETVEGVGEAFSGKGNQKQQQTSGNDANMQKLSKTNTPKTRTVTTKQSLSTANAAARPTKITSLKGGDNFTVTGMVINNVGMGIPIVRLRNSGIFLSSTGMSLIGKLSVNVKGQVGKRLIMLFEVLDENGEQQADNYGNTSYAIPLQISKASGSYDVEVRIPYGWMDLQKKPEAFNFEVSLLDFTANKDNVLVGISTINMDPLSISVDGNAAKNQVLSDAFGGGSVGGMDMGSIMGAMLGGGTDTAEHTCVKCDGTGICEYCDGDGFLDPSICRKCAQNPGICRSCQGTGTTTVKLDIDKSGW